MQLGGLVELKEMVEDLSKRVDEFVKQTNATNKKKYIILIVFVILTNKYKKYLLMFFIYCTIKKIIPLIKRKLYKNNNKKSP